MSKPTIEEMRTKMVEDEVLYIQEMSSNQLLDLLVYVAIYTKNKSPHYKLCIDCPIDTHPRLSNKLQDVLHTLVDRHSKALKQLEWEEYDDAETPVETLGLTPDFKEYVEDKESWREDTVWEKEKEE